MEEIINPNCSEAVVRIDLRGLNMAKATILQMELEKMVEEYDYDTEIYRSRFFEIPLIVVSGDMPYNDSAKLSNLIDKYTKKYAFSDN